MATEKGAEGGIRIAGIGTHKISFDLVDESVKERVLECIKKNGKISIEVGAVQTGDVSNFGFEQRID